MALTDFGEELRLDSNMELRNEAVKQGVKILSEESNTHNGELLIASSGIRDRVWGKDIWPMRNEL